MIAAVRALIVLLLIATTAHADEWVTPTPRTLASPDGKLQAVITPSTDGKSRATAKIGPKQGTATTFKLADDWMPVDTVLFDDGSLLTLDHWHSLGVGKVATFYGRDGKIRWTKTLEELVGKRLAETATHSVSSIWWRKTPLEWSLADDGKSGTITLFDENRVRLTLADGSSQLVAVPDLPADPPRLLARARALAQEDARQTEALALLDRAIAKDPDLFEAILLYVEIVQRAGDHARAIALLDRVSPRWKATGGYDVANACVAWAKSLQALSKHADAEQKLRLGITAAPTYVNPALALATLLVDQKRTKDADTVIDELVKRLLAQPYVDTYGVADAADFYKQRKEFAKALAIYLKAYKPTEVTNQFLYASLAQLHEEMGNDAEAIRVNEQLLAYFQKMGSAFDSYLKSTRAELARLRAKKPKR